MNSFRVVVAVLACLAPISGLAAGNEPSGTSIQDLLRELEANEKLYDRIRYTITEDYALRRAPLPELIDEGVFKSRITKESAVIDGKRYRFTQSVLSGELVYGRNALITTFEIVSDGRSARSLRSTDGKARYANLRDDWRYPSQLLWPHTMLCASLVMDGRRLSEFLRTPEYGDYVNHTVRVAGEEEIDGHSCVQLISERSPRDSTTVFFRTHFWLARDRNLLPIQSIDFGHHSEKIPLGIHRVADMVEAAPGVWMPTKVQSTVNFGLAAQKGEVVVSNQSETLIDDISLDPEFDEATFTKLEIPPGTLVYEFEDGKVVNGYVQGSMVPGTRWTNRLWRLGILLLLLLAAWAAWRYAQRRRQG